MTTNSLEASIRPSQGKGPCRRLRSQGQMPAVAYGGGLEATALAVTGEEASRLRQGREIVLLPHQVEAFREMRRPRTVNGEDASRICLALERQGQEDLAVALGEVRAGRFMPVRVFNQ